jgi:hypothetical protein
MKRLARTLGVASTLSLALVLSNCSSFDPTDVLDGIFAAQKKPLPGERKPLFPSGTPGVSQGVPPDLVKGYQPPPVADATQEGQAGQAAQAAPAAPPKPKAKPKPKVAATPPADQTRTPTGAMGAAASARPPAPQSSPWPDPPPTRQSAGPAGGQTVWPDPPAPTVTR